MRFSRDLLLLCLSLATTGLGEDVPTIAGAPSAQTQAAKLPDWLQATSSGLFTADSLSFSLIHLSDRWDMTEQATAMQPAEGFPQYADSSFTLEGAFKVRNGRFLLKEDLRSVGPGAVKLEVFAKSDEPVKTNALALVTALPADRYAGQKIVVDGRQLLLPEKLNPEQYWLFDQPIVRKVMIATVGGMVTIEGPFGVYIQDDRKFNNDQFVIRLNFTPDKGAIKEARLRATIRFQPASDKK